MSSFLCLPITFREARTLFFHSFNSASMKKNGYRNQPELFEKHESLSDSHVIKQLFWGIQFKSWAQRRPCRKKRIALSLDSL